MAPFPMLQARYRSALRAMPFAAGALFGQILLFSLHTHSVFMKKTFQIALLLLFIGFLPSCYLTRALKYKNFDLKDINDFDTDTLKASTQPFHFIQSDKVSPYKTYLDTNLAKSQSFSFLVIRNDSILYENYWEQVNPNSLLPTFSVVINHDYY